MLNKVNPLSAVSAGTTLASSGTVVFSNSNGLSFGLSGNTVTGSYTVPSTAGLLSAVNVSAGATSNNLSALTFSNSNGVSFGLNGSTVTASVAAQSVQPAITGAADNAHTQTTGVLSFANSNGVTFGLSSGAQTGTLTASVAAQSVQTQNCVDVTLAGNSTSAGAGYALVSSGTLTLAGGNNVTLSQNGNAVTISAGGGGGAGLTGAADNAHTQTTGLLSFSNANGVTFGLSTGANTGTLTASVAAQSNQTGNVYASSNTFGTSSGTYDARTLSVAGSNWVSVAASNSGWVVGATWTQDVFAAGNTYVSSSGTMDPRSITVSGGVGIAVQANNSGWGVAQVPLSAWEPFPIVTGTSFSSHQPASWWFNRVVLPAPVAASNINVAKTQSLTFPGGTSQNSSGTATYTYSHGITVFTRQDYSGNYSNLTTWTTASFGVTASASYSSSSGTLSYVWVTDTTGGTSSYSTTSNSAGGISAVFSGVHIVALPCLTTFPAGEYFFAHQHSSTFASAAGGNAFAAFLSFSNMHIAPPVAGGNGVVSFGQSLVSTTLAVWGGGAGVASAITTNNTMGMNAITAGTQNNWYMAWSNR